MIRRAISSATDVIGLITWLDSAWVDGLGTVGDETTLYGAIAVTSCAYITEISRKRIRETDIRTSFIPRLDTNAALPAVNILINGDWCSALIDSGCSRSIFSPEQRQLWTKKHTYRQWPHVPQQGVLNLCLRMGCAFAILIRAGPSRKRNYGAMLQKSEQDCSKDEMYYSRGHRLVQCNPPHQRWHLIIDWSRKSCLQIWDSA